MISSLKVRITYRKDNPDTNILRALALSSMVILLISNGFHLKLLVLKEWTQLQRRAIYTKHVFQKPDIIFSDFVSGNWFLLVASYFICDNV